MAEVIISQLDRAFANPLETNRQVNFISDRDAISALRRWEGMQVYVKSELTTYELRGGILNEHWTDISGIDSANYTPTGGYAGTAQDIVDSIQTVTGGFENISITHIANLNYYVIADPYKINANYYSAAPTTVTLTVGNATNARIDVIYADINGLIGVLTGTPSVTPVKPIVSNSQRELTFRTVPALATVDPLVTNKVVFNDNLGVAGGEFDVDGWNLTALNFNSTAVAFSGTKSIYFDGVDPYFNVDFKNDVNIPIAGFSTFFFRIYVTEVLDKNASLFFHILDTSFVANGNYLTVKSGVYGFDRNVLNAWQLISIPVSAFNLTVTEIKGIRFMVSSIKKPKMYMDTITFQSNVSQPTLDLSPYELLSNKKTDVEANKTSNIFYAPIKAIYDWGVGLFISGSGTQNYLPKFGVGGKVVENSRITDNGTQVEITGRLSQIGLGGSNYFGENSGISDNLLSNNNLGFGNNSLNKIIGGKRNLAIGQSSLFNIVSENDMIAIGQSSIFTLINGGSSVGIGSYAAAAANILYDCVAVGYLSSGFTSGFRNITIGANSAVYIADGVTSIINCNDGVYLGANTKSLIQNPNNEIVIGSGAIGAGSNTATLGHTSITKTVLRGNVETNGSVQVGDNTAVASASNVGAIRYRVSGNNSYAEMCMQNGASSYIWETLTVHSW